MAIIGGGLVGASLACALAPLGLKLCLLEAVTPTASEQPSYDDRTLALSASSCRILQGLGLWAGLESHATAIRSIHVRELNRAGSVLLDSAELGLESFGHVVEAREFGGTVLQHLERLGAPANNSAPRFSLVCPARVDGMQAGNQDVEVSYTVDGGQQSLRARLVVGADGAESRVRTALGIEVERHDYRQTAIICNASPAQNHAGRAFESFTPTGPFALLPHRDGRCGLVWSVATEQAEALLGLPDEEFLQQAEQRFGDALGRWRKIGHRSGYPLKLVRAKTDWQPRVVLLGNAAHAIHPIAAQGFNLGLRDVAVLAEVLADGLAAARRRDALFDPGATALLQAYSDLRREDHRETIAYTDGLARLYASPGALAAAARRAGLLAHRLVPLWRRRLAIRAMGFRGHIPRLALGESLAGQAVESSGGWTGQGPGLGEGSGLGSESGS